MDELKNKIAKAIEQDYVGNFVFSEEELTELYSCVGKILREYLYGSSSRISLLHDEIVFVAMVNASKNYSKETGEKRFWKFLSKQLIGIDSDCPQRLYKALTEIIDRLGSTGKIRYLGGNRFYNTVLMHAFAPLLSTTSFFDLCWQIYCEDMSQYYNKDDTVFDIAAHELSKRLGACDNDEDFLLGSTVYSLRAGIKRLAVDKPEEMATLIQNTIKRIHMLFNSEPIEKKTYFDGLIYDWWRLKESSFGIERTNQINKVERAVSDYSAIKAKYRNESGQIYIYIPAFRLSDNFDRCPWVEVYNNDEILLQEELLTRGSGLLMTTKGHQIALDRLLPNECLNIRVTITHCNNTIYDSKSTLFRSFVLFNGEREITAQECLPGNYQLFSVDEPLQSPKNIRKEKAFYYIFNAIDGDFLQSSKRTVIFASEKQHRDIWVHADKKKGVKFRQGENEYDVIDGELMIATSATSDLTDYGVRYEDSIWKLQEFSSKASEDILLYNISELLSVGEPQNITVFKYSTEKIVCRADIVKFNDISISFDKPYYYDKDRTGTVHFITKKYDVKTSFDIDQSELSLSVADGEIILEMPIIRWRIDDREWNTTFQEKGIWYKDFNNSSIIEMDVPISVSYKTLLTPRDEELEKTDNQLSGYKLGQQIYSQLDRYDNAMLLIDLGEKNYLPILRIHTSEKFIADPYTLHDYNHLKWNPINTYVGDENDYFDLSISDKNGSLVKTISLDQSPSEIDLSDIEDGHYTLNIDLKPKSIFKGKRTLLTKRIIIGNENRFRFRNKTLSISQVMLQNEFSPTYIKTIHIDNLRFLEKTDECLYYSGYMYFIHNNGHKIYLTTMKNDENSFDKTNPVRIELRSDNSCWLVAGLESDSINNFLGELFLDQYHQLSNITKGTSAIDYYLFSTKETKNV